MGRSTKKLSDSEESESFFSDEDNSNDSSVSLEEEVMGYSLSEDSATEDLNTTEDFESNIKSKTTSSNSSDSKMQNKSWGKHKKSYYEDEEEVDALSGSDAELVAEETMLLQKEQQDLLSEEDFYENDSFKKIIDSKIKPIPLESCKKSAQELEHEIIQVAADIPDEEKLALLAKHSPEFLNLLEQFKSSLKTISLSAEYLTHAAKKIESATASDEGISFLAAKNNLLSMYCANILYYFTLKAQGASIDGHPVIEQLVKFRLLLDKVKPLEAKIKHQIDRLIKLSETSTHSDISSEANPLSFKPNLASFTKSEKNNSDKDAEANVEEASEISSDSEEISEIEDEPQKVASGKKETAAYKIPKITPTFYEDSKKRAPKLTKDSSRILKENARLMKDLKEEFSEMPEELDYNDIIEDEYETSAKNKKASVKANPAKNRERYEEENFTRIMPSKKERIQSSKRRFTNELASLNTFGSSKEEARGKKPKKHDRKH